MANNGRFGKLDFDKKGTSTEPVADPWPNLDEDACIAAGDEAYSLGKYEVALSAYSRALRYNKDASAAWIGQVRCLISLGEYREAVVWANRALDRFPASANVLACKGLALALDGDIRQGMEYLDGAVEMRATSAFVWAARGESLLLAPNSAENAHRCFLKALEIAPEDWSLMLRIAIAYNRAKLYGKARDLLQAASRFADRNPLVLFHLGASYEGLGQYAVATGYYQRALDSRGDFNEAKTALRRAQLSGPFGFLKRVWRMERP